MNSWRVIEGDALERLRELDDGCVQTCVTSPPYFGLRDYGDEGQLGLEATPDEYVARLVEVFREVKRVLRDDGTLWLNLGDSYAGSGERLPSVNGGFGKHGDWTGGTTRRVQATGDIKVKDLLGIPWMVAFALRADGWYLRMDCIWNKLNPMPESVTDRPTKAHEYVFLLSKKRDYYYDADAVREEGVSPEQTAHNERYAREYEAHTERAQAGEGIQPGNNGNQGIHSRPGPGGRNKRSVWTVATQPFPGAHFAVFPPKLIEPCVKAGSAEDACGVCGAPWVRVVERETKTDYHRVPHPSEGARAAYPGGSEHQMGQYRSHGDSLAGEPSRTVGFAPSCRCHKDARPEDPHPYIRNPDRTGSSVVLDPFSGAGTTGLVATRLGRSYIGIELNESYAEMSRERIRDDQPLFNWQIEAAV